MTDADLSAERPTAIVVRLFDDLIARIERAGECCRSGDIEARYEAIVGATDILVALHDGLDLESDDDWTRQTSAIYRSILVELPSVILRSDPTVADRSAAALEPLRAAWAAADAAAAREGGAPLAVAAE